MPETKRKRPVLKIIILAVIVLLIVAGIAGYTMVYGKAISISSQQYFVVPKGRSFEQVVEKLEAEAGLGYPAAFTMLAERMNVHRKLRAGRYTLQPGMSNRDLAVMFRTGGTRTTDLVIRGLMGKRELAQLLGSKLEPDTDDYMQYLHSPDTVRLHGFSDTTILCMVLPDTYNVYWMSSPDDIFDRLNKEYRKYWTESRKQKAAACGLSPVQVSILASIVDKETSKESEMATIAGLYINRLRAGIPLQSDPTVKFALDSPEMKRIYFVHTRFPSPYNTYLIRGLPPGPLCVPSKQALNAVLNYTEHNLLFMCAKPDFSGYHNFAVTLDEHNINARRYQDALDRLEAQQTR